jgi:predicted permease
MNHHKLLRELSKIGVGLFIADLVSVAWFSNAGFFPLTVLGVAWDKSAIWPVAIFDLAVIILLAHYGWNIKLPVESPSERVLLKIAGMVFLVVCLVHLLRLAFGWTLVVGTATIPLWLSWLGVLIAGYLSYSSFHFARRR